MLGMEALRMALRALWNHKLRSAMTILGVVIGVGSVIAVVTLGAAFEASITSQFEGIDSRAVLVTAGAAEGVATGPPDAGPFGLIFTEVDRQALRGLAHVEDVAAEGIIPITGLTFDDRSIPFQRLQAVGGSAVGSAAGYESGRIFRDGEQEIVLGHTIATLLGDGTPIPAGSTITIEFADRTEEATVAGVLRFQESLFGSNNREVFVPLDPYYDQRRTSPSTGEQTFVYTGLTVFADDIRNVDAVRDAVRQYMDTRSDATRLLTPDTVILVVTAGDIVAQIGEAFDQVTLFIAAIAATSLLVGGIMIGTIMLISVTERTREIGVMKAIGARDRDVLWVFLLEAVLIGLLGGIVGLALGLGAGSALIGVLFGGEVAVVLPYAWMGIAVGVGVGTGVVAGLLPARRATKVEPVEALGYE
jgi:putative ABC transport system permease protein